MSPGPSHLTLSPSIPLGAYAHSGCVASLLNSGSARNPSFSINRSLPQSSRDSNEFPEVDEDLYDEMVMVGREAQEA